MKGAINLRGFQRFGSGTIYTILGNAKFIAFAHVIYNIESSKESHLAISCHAICTILFLDDIQFFGGLDMDALIKRQGFPEYLQEQLFLDINLHTCM